jgi:hypothetical protein
MRRYGIVKNIETCVFYPFVDGRPVSASELARKYPHTWSYLNKHKEKLNSRKAVTNSENWWRPSRPRNPKIMQSPKIITPHLVIAPKFSLDATGRYAVSHSPFFVLKNQSLDIIPQDTDALFDDDFGVGEDPITVLSEEPTDLLLIGLAILNSSLAAWYLDRYAHRYSRGYFRLEVATISDLPFPTIEHVSPLLVDKIATLTQLAIDQPSIEIEQKLDSCVAELFEFSQEDYARTFNG